MKPFSLRGLFLIAAAVVLLATSLPAQQIFGNIYGTVLDQAGAGVPNAKVTIADDNKGTSFEVLTNATGNYSKDRLLPGMYTVSVELPGFSKMVSRNVPVSVDNAARVDITLQVGDVATSVEVTASAPLLQSDRADIATTFTSKQLVELPRLDRNFQSFLLLSPGTTRLGWNHASSENPQGSIQIQVNGQHFGSTGYELDGTTNQDPILGIIVINSTIDSVGETKIAAQNYDAEFSYTGAGQINASTKSGSNQIHGSAFEYFRNNSPGFQSYARNPFSDAESKANGGVPPVKWNQFGGSIGGALIKNKLFYFGDAQLTRRRTGSSLKTSVPTLLARSGNLSEYLTADRNQVFDPATGDPKTGLGRTQFPNNVIPQNRISRQALAFANQLPLPNSVDVTVDPALQRVVSNFVNSGSERFDSNQWNTRWDYFINDKSSLFGRFSSATFDRGAPGAFGELLGGTALNNINFAGTSDVRNKSLAIGYTRSFSSTFFTDWRFGYLRYRVSVAPNGLGTSPAKDAGIPGLNLDNFFTSGTPAFYIQGDGGFNLGYGLGVNQCNCPLDQREQQYQFVGNATKIVGNHSIKFGGDIRRATNLRVPSDSHRAGELTFASSYTGRVDTNGNVQRGLGLATYLLGQVTNFNRFVSPNTDASERQNRLFWYVQDTWRITPKLQLNYGVRWELIQPESVNAPGNGGALDLRTGEIAVFGVGSVPNSGLQQANYKNFAPRVGLTYQLTPKTVIRAGYGWSYSVGVFGTLFGHNVTQNLPVLANQQLNPDANFLSVFSLSQGPPSPTFPTPNPTTGRFPLPNGISANVRPDNVVLPRVTSYNFTVQHQFAKDFAVQAGYVGNIGRHVFAGDGPNFNVNEPAFVPGVANSNDRRPFAKFGWSQGINFFCNCATNRYNSFQVQVDRRFANGYSLTGSYTYQVAVGDGGDSFAFLYDRSLARGNKDFLPHNQLILSQLWDVPFGRGRKFGSNINRVVDAVAGGWTINGISTLYSGRPFTPNIGDFPSTAIRPNAGPSGRPDQGTVSPYEGAKGGRDQWYVGGLGRAFLAPANNTFGNFGYNTLFGPSFYNQDLSLVKNFQLRESLKLSFRGEAFNVWNHTNLGDPETNVTSPNAGRITSLAPSYEARRLQFGIRLDF